MRLDLQPVSGLTIDVVSYTFSDGVGPGGPIPVRAGEMPTPGTASVPLPVATGYQLSLTAASAETDDNITCTAGFGPFTILPNMITDGTLARPHDHLRVVRGKADRQLRLTQYQGHDLHLRE